MDVQRLHKASPITARALMSFTSASTPTNDTRAQVAIPTILRHLGLPITVAVFQQLIK